MTETTNSKTRSKLMGCLIAALVPVFLVGMLLIVLIINNRPPNIKVPTHGVPKDNGFHYFMRASEAIETIAHDGPLSDAKGPDNWKMADYEAFMKANAPALAIFRQGLSKPCVSPAVRFTGQDNRFPVSRDRLRHLARTLRGEAMYYQKKGEYGRAVDSQMDCMEMGVSIPRGGMLTHDDVGQHIVLIGSSQIRNNLARLNPDQLTHAAMRIEHVRKHAVPYSEILMEESRFFVVKYSKIFGQSTEAGELSPRVLMQRFNMLSCSFGGPSTKSFVNTAQYAFTNKSIMISRSYAYRKKLAAETKKPYTGKWITPASSDFFSRGFDETALRGWQDHLQSQVTRCLIETEIALRRYQAANGRYPDKLSQLSPKYLKSMPVDPFGNGKPLRYRPLKNGKSFIVYSLGPNVKDDGGRPGDWVEHLARGDMLLGK